MKSQATRARAKQPAARRHAQTAPLQRMLLADMLRSWIIPSLAGAVGFAIFVLYNIGIIDDGPAVTAIGGVGLLVVLFYGLRGFTHEWPATPRLAALGAFVVLWMIATGYPFYRAINPGTPLFSGEVRRGGEPITVPVHGRTGHYNLVVEGHFIPAPGQTNRTATYGLLLSGAGGDRLLEGTFNQTWGTQRIGSGRRSSVVPVMTQTTQVLNPIDDRDGHDLTLKLTELSPGVREALGVRLYRDSVPPWLLIVLGIAALGAAIGVDTWRPKHVSEGLMATLTLAVLVSVATFRNAAAAAPGFPQLVIAALMGTLVGALGGSLLWRLVERARTLSARR